MKKVNKRGQMFLLAAIIISVVVIGFGTTSNFVRIKPELQDFNQFAYEVKHEAGAVVEYELFSTLTPGSHLDNFVDFLSADIRDRDPYANFMFIYGNSTNISLRNYGSSLAIAVAKGCDLNNRVCNVTMPGAGQNFNSTINMGSLSQQVTFDYDSANTLWKSSLSGDSIDVEIRGNNFNFPFGENIQIIFLNIKEIDDETFVAVE
jgi:hypothetical protein